METIVLKLGGSLLQKGDFVRELAKDLRALRQKVVLLHGGGPVISGLFEAFGKENRFVNGLRATNEETIDLVEMALSGQVNKMLARQLSAADLPAVGISGTDGGIFLAEPLTPHRPDANRVGKITSVSPRLLHTLWADGWLPVLSPVGIDARGDALNINADSAAYALARALSARALIFFTDVAGILKNGRVLPILTPHLLREGIRDGWIYSGMIPKLEQGFEVLQKDIRILIATWQGPHTVTNLLNANKETVFTELKRDFHDTSH